MSSLVVDSAGRERFLLHRRPPHELQSICARHILPLVEQAACNVRLLVEGMPDVPSLALILVPPFTDFSNDPDIAGAVASTTSNPSALTRTLARSVEGDGEILKLWSCHAGARWKSEYPAVSAAGHAASLIGALTGTCPLAISWYCEDKRSSGCRFLMKSVGTEVMFPKMHVPKLREIYFHGRRHWIRY